MSHINQSSLSRMQALLAKARAAKILEHGSEATEVVPTPSDKISLEIPAEETIHLITQIPCIPETDHSHILDKNGRPIILNSKQMEFVHLATSGASAVLIGAAGTGKTTAQKAVVQALISSGLAGILDPMGHKHLPANTPGIVICA